MTTTEAIDKNRASIIHSIAKELADTIGCRLYRHGNLGFNTEQEATIEILKQCKIISGVT